MNKEIHALEIDHVSKTYRNRTLLGKTSAVKIIDDVSFAIPQGKTLGLVGESGSGKSTVTRLALRQEKPTDGSVRFFGTDIWRCDKERVRDFRRSVRMVFQDPYSSLDPRMKVRAILSEPLIVAGMDDKDEIERRLRRTMTKVGLASDYLERFPREFSGGQRQRIAIARSLILSPRLLVLDEPVSSLDVSVRGRILNLLKDYQRTNNTAYLFISHDMASIGFLSDCIAVMYFGSIVEIGSADDVLQNFRHPYTEMLIHSSVAASLSDRDAEPPAELPSHLNPPAGCAFYGRCAYRKDVCSHTPPRPAEIGDGHFVSCHFAEALAAVRGKETIRRDGEPEYAL
ncbi:MAG: ATP-binding cassette domain-containing protein [Clostridiales Family XIII bacterium]|jgi:oligopeptide/dipeptide ABC transporter ATP-binding protein|nr:ATP-binding cassette domain-containing protein [Clostridiales Family XIII bacterium]